ncbi:MAG: hypothetical protein AAF728_06150 [Cyanobacteria bacterium P01_D01_bin.128]
MERGPDQDLFSPFARKLVLLLWICSSVWLVYGMFTQRYPATYLVEWQVQLFNGYYYPKITILLLLVAAGITSGLVGVSLDFITQRGPFRPHSD